MGAHQIVELKERGYACGLSGCAHALIFYADEGFEFLFADGRSVVADAERSEVKEADAVGFDEKAEEDDVQLKEGAFGVPI